MYDYKNVDETSLIKFIKDSDFCNTVCNLPIENQAETYTKILQDAFYKFVPRKTVLIRPSNQSWCKYHWCHAQTSSSFKSVSQELQEKIILYKM